VRERLPWRWLALGCLLPDVIDKPIWLVAQWLVAHAYSYGVTGVTVRGQRWTHDAVGWRRDPAAGSAPSYVLAPARSPG